MSADSATYRGRGHIRLQYQVMLILAVLLTVFYPVVFGEISRIDDKDIIDAIRNSGPLNLRDLFIPHMQQGAYYRPILILSFYADKYLFNLDPVFMHLHNIILHVINALLVFWLAGQLTQGHKKDGGNFIPLMSALFFGMHPITTEPVIWIAGRTDVLACTFILLSANCIIRFKRDHSYWYVAIASLFMALGFLTKEVALAFLPGAFLLMRSQDSPGESVLEGEASSQSSQHRYQNLFIFLFGFGAILLFFLLRHFAFESNSTKIGTALWVMREDTNHIALVFLQALGFYVKKIFFPFPLNFTIREVDPLYELLAVPVVAVCFLIVSKRSRVSALFITGIVLILPSFLIATGQIAWTSFAERYIYLPTAFIVTASVFFIGRYLEKLPSLSIKKEAFVTLLLAVMAITTFYRGTVWKSNLSLLEDTITKNPNFSYIRHQYADELAFRGDIKNARIQYTIANEFNKTKKRLKRGNELFQLRYWDSPELGLADLLVRENRIHEAIAAYEKIIRASNGQSVAALTDVLFLYGWILSDTANRSPSDTLKKKISVYTKKLYNISNNADTFYWLAKIFLMRGERQEALVYFRMAEEKYGADNAYKDISRKFIARLENK